MPAGNVTKLVTGLSASPLPNYAHPSTTTYSYYTGLNLRQEMTEAADPTTVSISRKTSYQYDLNDNLTHLTTGNTNSSNPNYAKPVTTTYLYDRLNRKTNVFEAVGLPETRQSTMVYDAADNLIGVTTGVAPGVTIPSYDHRVTTSYAYDDLNRRSATSEAVGQPESRRTIYEYDATDNVIYVTITPTGYNAGKGWVAQNQTQFDNTIRTQTLFDSLNRATLVTQAARSGNEASNFVNNTGHLPPVTATTYDATDNVISVVDPDW